MRAACLGANSQRAETDRVLGLGTDQRIAERRARNHDMPSLGVHEVDDLAIGDRVVDDRADMLGGVIGSEAHRPCHVLDAQFDVYVCSCR